MLHTDGKILAFMRCKAFGMHKTFAICDYLIKKNKNFGSWEKVMEIYFRNPDHPFHTLIKIRSTNDWTYYK